MVASILPYRTFVGDLFEALLEEGYRPTRWGIEISYDGLTEEEAFERLKSASERFSHAIVAYIQSQPDIMSDLVDGRKRVSYMITQDAQLKIVYVNASIFKNFKIF